MSDRICSAMQVSAAREHVALALEYAHAIFHGAGANNMAQSENLCRSFTLEMQNAAKVMGLELVERHRQEPSDPQSEYPNTMGHG